MKYTLGDLRGTLVHASHKLFVCSSLRDIPVPTALRLTPRYELEHDIREEPTTEPTVLKVGIAYHIIYSPVLQPH